MVLLNSLYFWTDQILFWALLALRSWAVVDCAVRRAAAFPAADKLTKPAWLAITVLSGLFGTFTPTVGPISLISAIVAAVYLADVRPAVREVSGGRGR